MEDILQQLKRARTILLLRHPFFGYLASKLKFEVTESVQTLATDGTSIFANPKFVKILTPGQIVTAVAHEVMHCACCHFSRVGSRKKEKWKIACDHAINPLLLSSGFEPINIPGVFSWLCEPEKYKGKTAEEIYDSLPDDNPSMPGCSILKNGCGASSSVNQDTSGGVSAEEKWKRALAEAREFARMRGNLPGEIDECVSNIIEPKISWKEIIRATISSSKKTDWSFRRPNRRYFHQGIVLPTSFGHDTSLEWWGDTSGSISDKFFEVSIGAAVELAEEFRTRVACGVFDAKVQGFWPNLRKEDIPSVVKFHGRGGTDFRPVFNHIRSSRRRPEVIVVVTDLCGYFPGPEARPSSKVIWLCPKSARKVEVPFGKKVFFEDSENGRNV